VHLPSLDIYLEDRENAPALIRPLNSSLRKALVEKRNADETDEMEKARSTQS